MRIGELKQLIDRVVDDEDNIVISSEAEYSGQAFSITNGIDISRAIFALNERNLLLNPLDEAILEVLNDLRRNKSMITVEQYNHLVEFIGIINQSLEEMMLVIRSFSPEQDPTYINIKLPPDFDNIEGLQSFNKRIDKLFKIFNSSGNFKIVGFDVGSSWYQVLIDNALLFSLFISSLDVALGVIKYRDSKKDSEEVRLLTKALSDITISQNELLKKLVEVKIEEDAGRIMDTLDPMDNRTKPESVAIIITAVREMIKEIDKGTQFHLSLNPPEYAEENPEDSTLNIKYDLVPKIDKPGTNPKKIEAVNKDN